MAFENPLIYTRGKSEIISIDNEAPQSQSVAGKRSRPTAAQSAKPVHYGRGALFSSRGALQCVI